MTLREFVFLGNNYATRKENISSFAYFQEGEKFKVVVNTKTKDQDVPVWTTVVEKEKEALTIFLSIVNQLK